MTLWTGSSEHSPVQRVSGAWRFQLVSLLDQDSRVADCSDYRWRILELGSRIGRPSEQAQGRKWFRPINRRVRPVQCHDHRY